METIPQTLERWRQSLCPRIEVAGLYARNPSAHKYKAPFRCVVLREALLWRMYDLAKQALALIELEHVLGARILIRSAIENFGILVYVSAKMSDVVKGSISYEDFDLVSRQLILGSKNQATAFTAVNVLTAIGHADKRHPKLKEMYEHFSETAHPNYDSLTYAYTRFDRKEFVTEFGDHWKENFGAEQASALAYLLAAFELEYNETWCKNMEQLEVWLGGQNDLNA